MALGMPSGPTPINPNLVLDRELEGLGNVTYVRADALKAIETARICPTPVEDLSPPVSRSRRRPMCSRPPLTLSG